MTSGREGEVRLHFQEGSSDKVYVAWLEPKDGGFHVDFAYGRRGSTLKTGRKTSAPLGREAAETTLNKLVASKTAKGYSPEESGASYQGTSLEARVSGVAVQLLNAVDEAEAEALMRSSAHVVQEKFDGCRLLVEKRSGQVTGINRRGLYVGLATDVAETIARLPASSCVVDGEAVGERLHAFDLLELNDENLRTLPYVARMERLTGLLSAIEVGAVTVVATALCEETKRALLEDVRQRGGEGVVFKEREAAHQAGRPNRGGVALKYKLVETCSALVAGVHSSKRSVSLSLLDTDGVRVNVGNVTVPPNQAIPVEGSVVEVRYLYALRGGSLYQPVLLGVRTDIPAEDCVLEQLKYKGEALAA